MSHLRFGNSKKSRSQYCDSNAGVNQLCSGWNSPTAEVRKHFAIPLSLGETATYEARKN